MGDGFGSESSALEPEFTGFYLVTGLSKLVRSSRAGYCLISFLIVAVPALIFYITGIQRFHFVSLTLYGGVFVFFILSRSVNNIVVKTSNELVQKAAPPQRKTVSQLIHGLMRQWFNPWWHLFFGLLLVFIAVGLAIVIGHPDWIQPSALMLAFVAGVTIWLVGGTLHFWHNLATDVIGNLIPIDPLDPDRMGGFRFVADHIGTWTLIESLRLAYVVIILMTIMWEMQIPEALTYFLVFFVIFVGIEIVGYFSVVYVLHQGFVRAKLTKSAEIASILSPLERKIDTMISHKQSKPWDQVLEQISPYAQSVLAIKVILDEYRYMREWPIDLPLILKIIFAILTPFLLLAFQWLIQLWLGILLP
jgi:hypothetical protein